MPGERALRGRQRGRHRHSDAPDLLGSVIVLDPKGENFAKTARRRRVMGDVVYRFDPYAADGRTHRYNPLDYVAEALPHERLKEAKRVAASLVTIGGNGQNFLGGARDIFAATALVMVHRETPTIAAIYDALAREGGSFKALATMAEEAQEAGMADAAGLLRQYAGYEARGPVLLHVGAFRGRSGSLGRSDRSHRDRRDRFPRGRDAAARDFRLRHCLTQRPRASGTLGPCLVPAGHRRPATA